MDKKTAPDLGETYVLDDEELEELEDSSFTSVMRDATATIERMQLEQEKRDRQGAGQNEDAEEDEAPLPSLGYVIPDD